MPYKLTPSAINLLKECPLCFWLEHRKGIKRPDGIFPSLPSGMDRILKEHFDKYAEKDQLPPELSKFEDVKIFKDRKLLDIWRNNWKGITYTDEKGNLLKGAVDAILVKGKKLIVLDYKTRGYPLKEDTHHHYIDQLNFYNFLLRKNGYDTEDFSYLLFYHPDKIVENVFLFHADLVKIDTSTEQAETLWKNALSVIEGAMPKASEECQYCRYREVKVQASLLDY